MTVTVLDRPDSQDEIEWLEQRQEEAYFKLRPYIVFGPLMEDSEWDDQACSYGPLEQYRPYVQVRAANAKEARNEAIKDRQFDRLKEDARFDNRNPLSRIRVMLDLPEHECVIDAAMDTWDDEADPEGRNLPYCDVCGPWNDRVSASMERLDKAYPL